MQEIAKTIYEQTPGIGEELPRNQSKILQNVKAEKKGFGAKGGEMNLQMKYEDWQKKYEDVMEDYKR